MRVLFSSIQDQSRYIKITKQVSYRFRLLIPKLYPNVNYVRTVQLYNDKSKFKPQIQPALPLIFLFVTEAVTTLMSTPALIMGRASGLPTLTRLGQFNTTKLRRASVL